MDPVAQLTAAVGEHVDASVEAVILYGSIARGQAGLDSDIDLAVIAAPAWDQAVEL